MREVFVADVGHFDGQPRQVIAEGDLEIGVFKVGAEFFAWENACPHQGGPVCQGKIMNWVEEQLDENKRALGQRFAEDTLHVVCPWHGFEFDLRTGRHPGDFPTRLKGYETRVKEGKVYVLVD
jgi:nitrite reductase/ring-hydroxylating ferredoxin subunit